MDQVRQTWGTEKTIMLREIEGLKERVHRLEGENSILKSIAIQATGIVWPVGSQQGGSSGASMENSYSSTTSSQSTSRSQNPSIPVSFSRTDPFSLSLGLDGAPCRAHFRSPGGSCMAPSRPSIPAPIVPLDPLIQPEKSIDKNFRSSPSGDFFGPAASIDVQDPRLDGITAKETAVKRYTFTVGDEHAETPPSPTTSPPVDAVHNPDRNRNSSIDGPSSGKNTPFALTLAEPTRMAIHVSHTSCRPLSLIPTVSSTEMSSLHDRSYTTTPTPEMVADASMHPTEPENFEKSATGQRSHEAWRNEHPNHLEPMLDSVNNKLLKGPLIKDIRTLDEIFCEVVNQKLKPVGRSLPQSSEFNPDPQGMDAPDYRRYSWWRSNGAHANTYDDDCDIPGRESVEADIPLKFKSTSNFGAPFGTV
ncbi:hypothetical protein NCS57_01481500 [Fusarium keratoplasticum]|uniref:Uncharacterized protein n=1 Tax=Fusarium keratoplasticum TaxID=1328300 RepID=A0ACC0QAR4_9HYPO|nr:hypothetical protein NCS57_01481500 [Fusarium keratoplasticum]KAI8648693.1 hypothetical protein NCS57_01481500 [Fusarium keratoplasticum]